MVDILLEPVKIRAEGGSLVLNGVKDKRGLTMVWGVSGHIAEVAKHPRQKYRSTRF
jgi:hypothetical protein